MCQKPTHVTPQGKAEDLVGSYIVQQDVTRFPKIHNFQHLTPFSKERKNIGVHVIGLHLSKYKNQSKYRF